MAEIKFKDWQVPNFEIDPQRRKSWVTEQMQDGSNFWTSQSTTQGIDQYLSLLSANTGPERLKTNNLKSDIKKFVETISDIREIGTLGTCAEQLKEVVEIENKVIQAVCTESHFPLADRKALQWAVCANRGYLWPRFIRDKFGWGQGKFRFDDLAGWDVMPSQVPRNGRVQGSYAITINEMLGVAEAHGRYVKFQDRLLPVASTRPLDMNHVRRLENIDRRRFADQPKWDEQHALDVETPIPTPTGWRRMGDLEPGDYVFGGDGSLCKVLIAHPYQETDSYRITFNDHSQITASADHRWFTMCKKSKGNHRVDEEKLRSTAEIFSSQDMIHQIEAVPIDMPETWLPIDPYLLGLWLGDGCKISGAIIGNPVDLREIERILHSRGHKTVSFKVTKTVATRDDNCTLTKGKEYTTAKLRIEGFERLLRTYGILNNKRIPMQYLRGSFSQRLDLLRGLMDTDGSVTKNQKDGNTTQCQWGQAGNHKELTDDVSELLNSLGIKNTWTTRIRERFGKEYIYHCTQLCPLINVFNLPRKKEKQILPTSRKTKSRYIANVSSVGKQIVRCITVSSQDHCFLAGRSMVRTHNCEINWTFVRDLRINKSGKKLQMGDPNSSWFYEVPSIGDLIVTINPENGLPQSRPATEEDCRIYPNLRLLITNPGISEPMYDGTAFDWHGMMPVVQYDVDDWPWLAVGYSLLQDVASIERAQRDYTDKMWRVAKVNLDPPMGYDLDAGIPSEMIKRFRVLDEVGTHIGVNGDPQAAFKSVLPDSVKIGAQDFALLDRFDALRGKALGLNDLSSLEKLKFNLSSDNVDKLLETIGPVAKGISFNMGVSHAEIVQMMKYMIPQYLDTPRAMAYAGPEAVKLQVLDYDPTSIVPSHLPGEEKLREAKTASNATKIQRAKWAAENMIVTSVPDSLLNITAMQEQLKWLNLFQQGAPVPFCEVAKQLSIKNWGDSPGATLFEKWKWEQKEMAEAKVEVMQSVAGEIPQTTPQPPQTGANKPNGQGKGGGRPPTAQQPPKLEQRGQTTGHPRTTISQSG